MLPRTGSGYGSVVTLASSGVLSGPESVVVSGTGNIFVEDYNNNLLAVWNRSVGPSLSFATSTNVGSSDSTDNPQTFTILNIGNEDLSLSIPTTGTNPSMSAGFSIDSSSTCPTISSSGTAGTLTQGASCTYGVDFTPTVAGTNTGLMVITDNNLGVTGPTQNVALSGTGIAAVTQLAYITSPAATVTAGGNAGASITVAEENASGTTVTSATDTIIITVTGPNSYSKTYTATAVNGVATFNLSSALLTTAGGYTYTASVSATPTITNAVAAETVSAATPTVVVTSSANPVFINTSVTYTAKMTGLTGVIPAGTVTFYDGTTSLGTATLSSAGIATLSAAPQVVGTHSITAVYAGSTSYSSATSNALAELAQDFSIAVASGSASSIDVLPGGTATFHLVITPLSGGAGPAGRARTPTGGAP